MPPAEIEVRPMRREELDLALDWAAAEGWNPGLRDAECFWCVDPDGFLVALQDGEPVGSLSAVRYPGGFAFGGLYIVRPEQRGLGIGKALVAAALRHVAGDLLGQDGVVAMQEKYKAMGFVMAHRNVRYSGAPGGEMPAGLSRLVDLPCELVNDLDRLCFGYHRPEFIRLWLDQPGGAALGRLEGGRLTAMGVIRPCREGFKIGPLFALDAASAEMVLNGLLASVDEGPVFWDVPQPNRAAIAMAQDRGMQVVFETGRMYRGGDPGLPLDKIYGITTFELG